jgi:hypothetical protein
MFGRVLDSDVMRVAKDVESELRQTFVKNGESIKRLGLALEKTGTIKPEDICRWIKHLLANVIKDGIISERTIENYCPSEWKHKPRNPNGSAAQVKTKEVHGNSGVSISTKLNEKQEANEKPAFDEQCIIDKQYSSPSQTEISEIERTPAEPAMETAPCKRCQTMDIFLEKQHRLLTGSSSR